MNCYYHNFAVTNRDSTPQLKNIDWDNFPIILPRENTKVVNFVNRMLSLNKQLQEIGDKKTAQTAKLEEEIKKTDEEINNLVYQLYGITEEEKKIIEESVTKR